MKTYDDPTVDVLIDTDEDVRIVSAKSVRVVRCRNLYASCATIAGVKITDPTPAEAALIGRIKAEIVKPGALYMGDWHKCETAHCLAGWAQFLEGDMSKDSAEEGRRLIPSLSYLFYTSNEVALKALGLDVKA